MALLIYDTPEKLRKRIDRYFDVGIETDSEKILNAGKESIREVKRVAICDLIRFCGFNSLQTFYNYEKRPGFREVIHYAKNRVGGYYERKLSGSTASGAIFALKNILGWKDVQDISITEAKPIVLAIPPERQADYNSRLGRLTAEKSPEIGFKVCQNTGLQELKEPEHEKKG